MLELGRLIFELGGESGYAGFQLRDLLMISQKISKSHSRRRCMSTHFSMNIDSHDKVVGVNSFCEYMANIATIGHVHAVNTDTNRVTGIDDV